MVPAKKGGWLRHGLEESVLTAKFPRTRPGLFEETMLAKHWEKITTELEWTTMGWCLQMAGCCDCDCDRAPKLN
jgi:hypothetical protein